MNSPRACPALTARHHGAGAPRRGHGGRAGPHRGLWALRLGRGRPYSPCMAEGSQHRLADGRVLVLRAAGPADIPAIAGLYLSLSAGSSYRRFHFAGRPAPALAARIAGLASGTVCVVAAPPGEPARLAAEARYVATGPGTAELALTVGDRYQGAGLGGVLLAELASSARAHGIGHLRALVMLDNTPMLRLIQRYGWVLAGPGEDFSVACLEIAPDGRIPGWPPNSAGRRVLVERRGWLGDHRVAALRAAGDDVRQCPGPAGQTGGACPLVTSGRCRPAEEADLIVSLLPAGDPQCAAVLAAHQRRWPHRLAT
jgi:GNAT superfamily N-acetyltransferase